MKKTLLPIFLAILMLVSLALPVSAATGGLTATATLSESGTGFTVDLIVNNNPGIIAMTASVSYDSKVLKLTSATNGKIFDNIFMPSQTLATNPYKIIWMDATADEDIKTNGVLATYTFEVLDSAAIGESLVKFNIDETVNHAKDNSSSFNGCSFKININGVANNTKPNGNTSSTATNSNAANTNTITNDQTITVQKPVEGTTSSESTVGNDTTAETNSNTTTIGASTEDTNDDTTKQEESKTNSEKSNRNIITIIAIAVILLAGICITLVAVYFRKKSKKPDIDFEDQED